MIEQRDLQRARALSDPTRTKLLDLMAVREEPQSVTALSTEVGLHHTVVRKHLKLLEQAGLVVAEQLPVTQRGRPSVGWRVVPALANPYLMLSGMLADALREGTSPKEQGENAGRRLASGGESGIGVIMAVAEELGFEPRKHDRGGGRVDIVLDHCSFAAVADENPDIVCGLHHGLASGIASTCGDVTVERLDVRPPSVAGCRLVLRMSQEK